MYKVIVRVNRQLFTYLSVLIALQTPKRKSECRDGKSKYLKRTEF